VEIYIAATSAIMPNPVIRHGKTIIATTLVYQDFGKFTNFVSAITEYGTLTPSADMEAIKAGAATFAKGLQDAAATQGKSADMSRAGSGCASLLLASVALWRLCLLF